MNGLEDLLEHKFDARPVGLPQDGLRHDLGGEARSRVKRGTEELASI